MGKHITPSLPIVELTTLSGETVVTPLAYPEVAWLGTTAKAMANRLGRAVQTHLIDEGDYLDALRITQQPDFQRSEIEVDFPAGRDPVLQPALRQRYTAFLARGEGERGLGYVPALGIVALAEHEGLRDAVVEAIRLEHRRNGRHADTRRMVAAHWFEHIELQHQPLHLNFHSSEELRRLEETRAEPLLKAVAEDMAIGSRPAVGLQQALEAMVQAVEGRFARPVLVVGAEGSGKTALIHQYVRDRQRRALPAPWETTAARLIQGLTGDGGWQHALAQLSHEIADRDVMLYVGHLAELFEVGQYQGNTVSLGEALREPLARGRLMLLAEATPSELATIELRCPGFTALFQQVRLPEQDDAEQQRIIQAAVAALAAEHRIELDPATVQPMIALQRRFSPYSGFPGKAIRFFEELILHARGRQPGIGRDEALEAFCAETGMPRRMLDPQQALDLQEVDRFFRQRLFGQAEAVDVVVGVLAATKTGLARTGKPIASLLLIGPTGVGKTETAKALAEFMFGDARRMIRIDMSEYADAGSVLRLLGDLGGSEGLLVGAVRRQPFSVVLFDELEKAHPSFFDLLLQVLGEGRLTGGDGLTANFCGSIVVMTSNLGAEVMQREPMAMTARRDDPRRHFEQAVQEAFRPELFNRIDHVVPFALLSGPARAPIFGREIGLMRGREGLLERALSLDIAEQIPLQLAQCPGDPRYGARDVQRVLRQRLLLPLAHVLAPHPHVSPMAVRIEAGTDTPMIRHETLQRLADHSPLQAADAATEARRSWQRLVEGPLYINLVNQVFRLDKDRQRHDKQRRKLPHLPHWDNTEGGARERELVAVRAEVDGLLAEVSALEGDALLTLLGEHDTVPDLHAWQQRFSALKQRAFHAVRPGSGVCTVGLYAPSRLIGMLREAWCELAAHAGFGLKMKVLRIDDSPKKPARANPAADPENPGDEEPAAPPYLKFDWPQTEGKRTLVVGFELELRGPAVYDYLRCESGVWRFHEGDRKTDAWVSVRNVALERFETPPDVHRQHFFDGMAAHRVVKQGQLSAVDGAWQCPFPHVNEWKLVLDRSFAAIVDRMLQGAEQ